jgi:hypothetical protein
MIHLTTEVANLSGIGGRRFRIYLPSTFVRRGTLLTVSRRLPCNSNKRIVTVQERIAGLLPFLLKDLGINPRYRRKGVQT